MNHPCHTPGIFIPIFYGIFRTFAIISEKMGTGQDVYKRQAYRSTGSLIAFETGESVTYGLFSAQERGTLFIGPGEKV